MITKTFRSRYVIPIFDEIQLELEKMDVLLIKDPYYLNKKGEGLFMISVNTIQEYNTAMQFISDIITNRLINDKKITCKKRTHNIRPLNIIL